MKNKNQPDPLIVGIILVIIIVVLLYLKYTSCMDIFHDTLYCILN